MSIPSGVSIPQMDTVLKTMYPTDRVYRNINMHQPVTGRLKRRKFAIDEGDKFKENVQFGFSDGGGERAEWRKLPQADISRHAWTEWNIARYDRTVRWSGEALENTGSVVDIASKEMGDALKGSRLDAEMAVFLGQDNKRASLKSVASATSFVVTDHIYLRKYMRIDILPTATGLHTVGVVGATITGFVIDKTTQNATITIDIPMSAFATIAGDLTTYGVYRTGTYGLNYFGWADVISTANPASGNFYGGIDRTTNDFWQAQTLDAGGPATGFLFAQAITEIQLSPYFDDTSPVSVIWVHPFVHNDLIRMAKRDTRQPMSVRNFQLWGDTVMIGNVPVLRSNYCPPANAYVVAENSMRFAHPRKMPTGRWIKHGHDSGTIVHQVEGYWGYQAAWIWRRQMVCMCPGNNSLITGITWSAGGTA